jgi:hypothetical protein
MQSALYGQYQLYSKNGLKFIGKCMSKGYVYNSVRNASTQVLRYRC